jgi:membrane-bound serine protease (ClpP class)
MNSTRLSIRLRRWRGTALCLLLAMLGMLIPAWSRGAEEEPAKGYTRGVLIRFDGPITPMLAQYLYRKLGTAQKMGADLVVVQIDSPGGYLNESLDIARRLRDTDWAHTVAYIPNQALSGAAIVALGCDEIIMGPEASLGDCGPIFRDENFMFRYAPEKIRTDLARKMRDLARYHGRPPALAEAMVDMDLVVYKVKDRKTGKITYMSASDIESAKQPGDWEKLGPVPESRKGHFLEVNGARAVELGLASANVSSRPALEKHFQLREPLTVLQPTAVDTAVYVLNLPVVTGLLILVGLVALYIELSAPGIGVGGLIAFLCFGLFFWSRFLGGTAGWLEVVLFISGAVFLAVELFVTPGFGFAGVTGILLLLASLVLASQDFIVPTTGSQWGTMGTTLAVLGVSATVFLVAAGLISYHFGTIPILNRLALTPPDPSTTKPVHVPGAAGQQVHPSGVKVGDHGIADSRRRRRSPRPANPRQPGAGAGGGQAEVAARVIVTSRPDMERRITLFPSGSPSGRSGWGLPFGADGEVGPLPPERFP